MGVFALQTADMFQNARNEFGILLGDMEAGAGLFNQIKAFNDKTPFDLSTLTQATNVLIAAKVPLSELESQLTTFGDLAQGNSQRLTSYIHAFSQAAAKGKADMQVLNTYLNQGVPILGALAERFNVTTAEVMEMSSQGQISFEDFSAALDDLTAAGGRYFGGMELASQSLAAMQEGLNEAVNSLAASFGEMLLPIAIGIVDILTQMTNAINESPLLKGTLAGALVLITGYMGAMAIKAAIAFAHQMALNLAIGALNPVVLATTVAVAAMAAGYVAYASKVQAAKREQEDFALSLKTTAREYADAFAGMSAVDRGVSFQDSKRAVSDLENRLEQARKRLEQLQNTYDYGDMETRRHNKELKKEAEDAIKDLERRLESARSDLEAKRQGYDEWKKSTPEVPVPNTGDSAAKAARAWLERWNEEWKRFQGEQMGNPFAGLDIEWNKKLGEAQYNGAGQETIDQINEYYRVRRTEIAEQLADDEKRRMWALTGSKIDTITYEMHKELEAIDLLEQQRLFAAGNAEADIAAIREQYAVMRQATEEHYQAELAQTQFEEARAAVVDWQQTLNDNLSLALLNMEAFSSEAAIILGDLSAQFLELSTSAALDGFQSFGRALGEGKDAADALQSALAAMAQQILRQLPMMFLQAGLQLIANGQWALGLGFVAAAASSALISGYVDGITQKARQDATENATGGVYDEYGKAARAFAAGGAFTNQIVNRPTYFRYGGSLGVMGEAGPEAIMPLRRGPDGSLGVETSGAGGTTVVVNIINNTNAEVRQEEHDDESGGRRIDVIIGDMVNSHIASGKADSVMGGRYGLRTVGV